MSRNRTARTDSGLLRRSPSSAGILSGFAAHRNRHAQFQDLPARLGPDASQVCGFSGNVSPHPSGLRRGGRGNYRGTGAIAPKAPCPFNRHIYTHIDTDQREDGCWGIVGHRPPRLRRADRSINSAHVCIRRQGTGPVPADSRRQNRNRPHTTP